MLLVAGVLMVLLGIGHSILGERFVVGWLLERDELPPMSGGRAIAAGTIRFAWHVTSMLAIAIGVALALFGFGASPEAIVGSIGGMLVLCAVLPAVYTRWRHPSWLIFALSGTLCLVWAFIGA
ncbi:hypothetical protein [Agromyces salentinus]|uniref:DUF1304 family protein n=1 Tax=Agromyces salentinus TaxID=269421 RepID=A0ABP4YY02_9MICO|nr:hypothetical protein [Agromyces salentinus]